MINDFNNSSKTNKTNINDTRNDNDVICNKRLFYCDKKCLNFIFILFTIFVWKMMSKFNSNHHPFFSHFQISMKKTLTIPLMNLEIYFYQ